MSSRFKFKQHNGTLQAWMNRPSYCSWMLFSANDEESMEPYQSSQKDIKFNNEERISLENAVTCLR